MNKFDIVFVTYNSSKWIKNCLNSILKNDYNLKNISLFFYDNNSSDDTLKQLDYFEKKIGSKFNDFKIIKGSKNKGFGIGNNIAASYGDSPYIFICNVDTVLPSDLFKKLSNEIDNSNEIVGMWELKQLPYEHPKYYDPVTGYTSWASGACMIIKRCIFEKIGGFDKNIFMYCEDVEISWHVRRIGYKIKYLPNVEINHYSYLEPNEFKYNQYINGLINNYYLRAKYGSKKNFLKGFLLLSRIAKNGSYIPNDLNKNVKRKIKRKIRSVLFCRTIKYLFINIFGDKKVLGEDNDFCPKFLNGFDYEVNKCNPFFEQLDYDTDVLVSIVVRTCGRPDVLRETLTSLSNQTYKNFEVVIVEDGKDISRDMIYSEFSDLNVNYYATGEKKGRSVVANIGMSRAKGKYINFLDDDDAFYPDHIETLVKYLEKNKVNIAYTLSFNTQVEVFSKKPYVYKIHNIGGFGWSSFRKKRLYEINLFPIQAVMFRRELFKECGGIDENVDALEDWDFWIRLSLKNNFYCVNHTTSVFRTPFKEKDLIEREKFLQESLDYLSDKFKTYIPEFTVYDYFNENR